MKNWKTTGTGILGIVLAIGNAIWNLIHKQPVDWMSTGTAIATGAGLISASDAKPSNPPSGNVAAPILIAVLVLFALSAPRIALSDEPKFGGCLKNNTTCFGPSINLSLVAMDLEKGTVTAGVSPGIGYGMTWNTGKWWETGVDGFINFRDTEKGQRAVGSVVLSFAEYLRLGIGLQFGDRSKPFLLLGVGANFGNSPSKESTPAK